MQAAKELTTSSLDVTIIDKHNYHLFQPLLYQVATAGLSPADIALPIRNIFRSQQNIKVILDELIGINPQLNKIITKNNTYFYDFLILATGSEVSYFGHEQWESFAPGLKSIEDATFLRGKILQAFEKAERIQNQQATEKIMKFVIIGGGPTGVEIAGAIAELSKKVLSKAFVNIDPKTAQIILLEAGENILPTASYNLSVYAKNKVMIEKFLLNKKNIYNFPIVILRFATAFGWSPRMRFDLTINEFVRSIVLNENFDLYDPFTWRTYCHVKDI